MPISQHAVTKHFILLQSYRKVIQGVQLHSAESACRYTRPTGDTNFNLKSSAFIPIAGILELVNRTLVNGVPLLTWRRKRGR